MRQRRSERTRRSLTKRVIEGLRTTKASAGATKFRAWHKKEARFLDGTDPRWCVSPEGQFCWWNDHGGWSVSEDCEVLEWTGRTDKNGKEIYEGDILSAFDYDKGGRTQRYRWIVQWNPREPAEFAKEGSRGVLPLTAGVSDDFADDEEIIGNIHENPDLVDWIDQS